MIYECADGMQMEYRHNSDAQRHNRGISGDLGPYVGIECISDDSRDLHECKFLAIQE